VRIRRADGWPIIALAYLAIALIWTWPLARHLGTRLAGDVGDPAFNCWVLAWTAGQILAALAGDFGALGQYWQGNIFSPEPLTLTYSEHLTGQTLQILPIYAVSGNIVTSYNLLFIATFALSGLAMYLLVRDLTREPAAAFLAGLAFAYAPYRLGQFSHVQVLSSYWMPLALLGLHRFFVRAPGFGTAGLKSRPTTRATMVPLAGSVAAIVMQNLSCGYYMLFFAPFVAAYAGYEMVQRRLVRHWRVWSALAIAAGAVALLTFPFVRPYFQVRNLTHLGVRSPEEIRLFSADTHAFSTIAPNSRHLAEPLSGYPHPEGEGFSGFTILAFAGIGLAWAIARVVGAIPWRSIPEWQVLAIATSGVLLAGSVGVVVWYFVHGQLTLSIFGSHAVRQNATQPLTIATWSFLVFAIVAALARRRAGPSPSASGFFVVAVVMAALFALGPRMQALGRDLGDGPYRWLLDYVPGFDGLRVPARFLMLVALFLAVLAGLGAAVLLATRRRAIAYVAIAAGAAGILYESWVAPLQMNQPVIPAAGFTVPAPPVSGRALNPIYRVIRDLPDPVLLAELPFGEPAYEVLAVFYAGHHRRPLLNGYSGFFPRSYLDRAGVLHQLPDRAGDAERLLREARVTHVLVHEGAFPDDRGQQISAWLVSIGARPVTNQGRDKLFQLK
jgi:hypothetical protein